MKNLMTDYPKAWAFYKEGLIDKYKNEYDGKYTSFLTDDILIINLEGAPMSATFFFDGFKLIGTYDYNYEDKVFEMKVNGENIDVHEDHQYSADRREAEKSLIKYLFSELEKTL
jgi:hypothetical protein